MIEWKADTWNLCGDRGETEISLEEGWDGGDKVSYYLWGPHIINVERDKRSFGIVDKYVGL